ncbi:MULTISPECIES: hypothetical protein [Streptomyces]|uniref:hypothetical protein n=1 Tax=Streptomyces TaxID=1883 RepID=UPI002930805E|nr:hypothetical protein [Streptomyces sp. NEAU-HV9]
MRPGTYSVAIHGSGASGSASTTGAVNAPLTLRAAVTSCRNRAHGDRRREAGRLCQRDDDVQVGEGGMTSTSTMFSTPSDPRTADYVEGRFG